MAREEHRDGYQRLLSAARGKQFGAIIVESQDRLWRNQAEMHTALRRLRFWGVKVFSVATGADLTDKAGRLIASVMGWRDEAYLDDLAEKTRRGLAGQARRGFSAGGRAYGYRTEAVTDPSRLDAHGQPRVLGYQRVIEPAEAAVVRRIFDLYASGLSPKRIGLLLNQERVPPSRSTSGWTWTAIYGNPALGTGILNNSLYVGNAVWNKFRWERDPETGKRVPRPRPRDEWVVRTDEALRIVPQGAWDAAKSRQEGASKRSRLQVHSGGRPPKYLFSGLLVCGVCGARYVMRDRGFYCCSFHHNRGAIICQNSLMVNRRLLERLLLHTIRHELFTPEAIAYVTQRVNEALEAVARQQHARQTDRRQLEGELRAARAELDNIKQAIRQGLISNITRTMLEGAEVRVQDLSAQLEEPVTWEGRPLTVLPQIVRRHLDALQNALERDTDQARAILRRVLGDIVLRPSSEGLVAELRGNVRGLLTLSEQTPMFLTLVAGAGFAHLPTMEALLAQPYSQIDHATGHNFDGAAHATQLASTLFQMALQGHHRCEESVARLRPLCVRPHSVAMPAMFPRP